MSMTTATERRPTSGARMSDLAPWFVGGGLALVALGVLSLLLAVITTFASVVLFGGLLAAGGLLQVTQATRARGWAGIAFYLLTGVVTAFAGVSLIVRPGVGALALTLLLAGFFMAQGVFRVVVAALVEELPGRWLQVVNGVVTFALGVIIGAQWPEDALWVIGAIVGIDLIATGTAQLVTASELRRGELAHRDDLGGARPGLGTA